MNAEVLRTPPQNLEAERAVLGSMLLSADAVAEVADLKADDFYAPANQLVFDAAMTSFVQGDPIDAITVANQLNNSGAMARVGGPVYLHTLISSVATPFNVSYYAKIVAEQAGLRRLVSSAHQICQWAYDVDGEPQQVIDRAQQAIYDVTQRSKAQDYRHIAAIVSDAVHEVEATANGERGSGIATGLPELDRVTMGLQPRQMITVAARPAVGKSTLALDWARHAAIRGGHTAVVFSLEMSEQEMAARLLSAEAGIGLHKLRSGQLTDPDFKRIVQVQADVSTAPLFLDDSPNLTMPEIRAKARRLKQQHDLKLVVVDYLQLMQSGKRVESRQVEVSDFSRNMKLLAKELNVPVVVLSQLNRGPESRTDKKPVLSDLRESGSIEQDSDVVILIHREDVYDKYQRPGEADLLIAKNRSGPTSVVTCVFQGHYSRFVPMG